MWVLTRLAVQCSGTCRWCVGTPSPPPPFRDPGVAVCVEEGPSKYRVALASGHREGDGSTRRVVALEPKHLLFSVDIPFLGDGKRAGSSPEGMCSKMKRSRQVTFGEHADPADLFEDTSWSRLEVSL